MEKNQPLFLKKTSMKLRPTLQNKMPQMRLETQKHKQNKPKLQVKCNKKKQREMGRDKREKQVKKVTCQQVTGQQVTMQEVTPDQQVTCQQVLQVCLPEECSRVSWMVI